MKRVYKLAVLFLAVCFVVTQAEAQKTISKTLIKSVALHDSDEVSLALNGNVDVKEWSNDYVQIEAQITVQNLSAQYLKALVAAGRYNITSEQKGTVTVILTPNLGKEVKIRGQVLKDNVVFTVFAPENVKIEITGEDGLSLVE